jgi:hypothetical protein
VSQAVIFGVDFSRLSRGIWPDRAGKSSDIDIKSIICRYFGPLPSPHDVNGPLAAWLRSVETLLLCNLHGSPTKIYSDKVPGISFGAWKMSVGDSSTTTKSVVVYVCGTALILGDLFRLAVFLSEPGRERATPPSLAQ